MQHRHAIRHPSTTARRKSPTDILNSILGIGLRVCKYSVSKYSVFLGIYVLSLPG
jgi:hypothetical protein